MAKTLKNCKTNAERAKWHYDHGIKARLDRLIDDPPIEVYSSANAATAFKRFCELDSNAHLLTWDLIELGSGSSVSTVELNCVVDKLTSIYQQIKKLYKDLK